MCSCLRCYQVRVPSKMRDSKLCYKDFVLSVAEVEVELMLVVSQVNLPNSE